MRKEKLHLLKDVTLTRRQVAIFKLCVFSGGVLFTIYLHDFFVNTEWLRWILTLIPGVYLGYVYFKPAPKVNTKKRK
ncbi:MAG: hypothetical protein WAZ12_03350 [Candidatus Absconditicoccaceae bacterium]